VIDSGVHFLNDGVDNFGFHGVVVFIVVLFSITKIQQFFETTKFIYTFLQKKKQGISVPCFSQLAIAQMSVNFRLDVC
jgi:hypothetical protein